MTFINSKTGEIKYTLPEPASVRLRIGIRNGGPMLRTLLDWELREKGPHVEVWDKKKWESYKEQIESQGDAMAAKLGEIGVI